MLDWWSWLISYEKIRCLRSILFWSGSEKIIWIEIRIRIQVIFFFSRFELLNGISFSNRFSFFVAYLYALNDKFSYYIFNWKSRKICVRSTEFFFLLFQLTFRSLYPDSKCYDSIYRVAKTFLKKSVHFQN